MEALFENLSQSDKPLTKLISRGNEYKVIAVGLNEKVALRKHTAPGPAKIFVVKGQIQYISLRETVVLNPLETYDIPREEEHEVLANEPSVFLLIVG